MCLSFKPPVIAILLCTFLLIEGGSEICSNPPKNCHPIPGRDSCFRENNSSRNSDWLTSARTCERNGGRLLWLYNNNITEFMKNNTNTTSTSPCPNCTFMWIGLMLSTFHDDHFFWKRTQNETKEQCRISISNETCAFNATEEECELLGCCYNTSNCFYAGDVETDRQHEYYEMNQAFHNTPGYRRCVGLHKPNDILVWAFSVENCSKSINYTQGYFCEHRCGSSWPVPIAKPNNTNTSNISPDPLTFMATFTSKSSLTSITAFLPSTVITSIATNKSKSSTTLASSNILPSISTNLTENNASIPQSFTFTPTPMTKYSTSDVIISPSVTITPSMTNKSANILSASPSPTISTAKINASVGHTQLSYSNDCIPTTTPASTKNVSLKSQTVTILPSTSNFNATSCVIATFLSLPAPSSTTTTTITTPTQNAFLTPPTSFFQATTNISMCNTSLLKLSNQPSTTTFDSIRNVSFSPLTTIYPTTVHAVDNSNFFLSSTLSPTRKKFSASNTLLFPTPILRPTTTNELTGDKSFSHSTALSSRNANASSLRTQNLSQSILFSSIPNTSTRAMLLFPSSTHPLTATDVTTRNTFPPVTLGLTITNILTTPIPSLMSDSHSFMTTNTLTKHKSLSSLLSTLDASVQKTTFSPSRTISPTKTNVSRVSVLFTSTSILPVTRTNNLVANISFSSLTTLSSKTKDISGRNTSLSPSDALTTYISTSNASILPSVSHSAITTDSLTSRMSVRLSDTVYSSTSAMKRNSSLVQSTTIFPTKESLRHSTLPSMSITISPTTTELNTSLLPSIPALQTAMHISISSSSFLQSVVLSNTSTNNATSNISFSPPSSHSPTKTLKSSTLAASLLPSTTVSTTITNASTMITPFLQSTSLSVSTKIQRTRLPTHSPPIKFSSTSNILFTDLPSAAIDTSHGSILFSTLSTMFSTSTVSKLLQPSTAFYYITTNTLSNITYTPQNTTFLTAKNTSAHSSKNSSASVQKITNINTDQGSNGDISAGAIVGISMAAVAVVVVSSVTTIFCIRHFSKARIGAECNESPGLSMTQNNTIDITFNTEREPTEYHAVKERDSPIQTAST